MLRHEDIKLRPTLGCALARVHRQGNQHFLVVHWLHIIHDYLTAHPLNRPDFMFMHCSLDGPLPPLAAPSRFRDEFFFNLGVLPWTLKGVPLVFEVPF